MNTVLRIFIIGILTLGLAGNHTTSTGQIPPTAVQNLIPSLYAGVRAGAASLLQIPQDSNGLFQSTLTATDDVYVTDINQTLTVAAPGVLSNDTGPNGATLTVAGDSDPANGTLTLNTDGSFTYTPSSDYRGSDSFSYHFTDGTDTSNIATVSLTINAPPVAVNDTGYTVNENGTLTVNAAAGVLLNDTDPDSNPLTAVKASSPAHGTVTLNSNGSFTYTPTAGYYGADSFTYHANDGRLDSNDATVTITINAAPVGSGDSYNANQGQVLTVNAANGVLSNDNDPDGDTLTAIKDSDPTHGTLNFNSDGSFTYTASSTYHGADSFTYHASDGSAVSAVTTVTFAVNALPVAANDSYNVNQQATLTVAAIDGVLKNDTDADAGAITAVLFTSPAHGALTLNSDGSFTYTPTGTYSGLDSFIYYATDGKGNSTNATVTITINGLPVANNDTYLVNENTTLTVAAPGVLGNDTDPEQDPLTAHKVSDVTHGLLTLNANGSFTYTPTNGYYGSDSFTYYASDGSGNSANATVTITVNAPPVAVNDSYTVNENATLTLPAPGLLANDSDPDGNSITAAKVANPAHGTVTVNSNGSFTYNPASSYSGPDSFTYQANDGNANSAIATVNITVNAPPVAVNDSYLVTQNATLNVPALGVLANDSDPDGNPITAVKVTDPTHGTLTLNSDGSLTYIPTSGYHGSDSFTYHATDGNANSSNATVTITVNAPPAAVNDSYTVNENASLSITASGLLSNDTDADGNPLSAVKMSDPAHGTLTLNSDGSFTYTPSNNYYGADSFTYHAVDSNNASSANATVSITVNAPPVAVSDSYKTNENQTLSLSIPGVLGNDSDPDHNTLSAVKVSDSAHGTLQLNSNGSFTYVPQTNYFGADSFTYMVWDGNANSANTTVSIAVNAPPVAVNDSYQTNENGTLTKTAAEGVLANDSDPNGDTITAVLAAGPTTGTLTLNSDGSFIYTPNTSFHGTDSFTYHAYDGNANSSNATVSITVNGLPVAAADSYAVNEQHLLNVAEPGVLSNDSDPEHSVLTAVKASDPTHGTLTLNANGSFTYTPQTTFNGIDTFTYRAYDGSGYSNLATVTINANATPVALNDSYLVNENNTLTTFAPGVLSNDTDAGMETLTAVKVTDPTHGALTLNANGSFSYVPTTNYYGPDSFTYRTSDGVLQSSIATVSITVNAPPVAAADAYLVNENNTLTILSANGVLSNDSDPDHNPLTAVKVTSPIHGTATVNADGSFTYIPVTNYFGPDSFTYHANDGNANSADVMVSITVNAPPIANGDSYLMDQNQTLAVASPGLLGNDSDPDANPISAVKMTDPSHGTLALNANGSFTYTPSAGYYGVDSFTYRVSDGNANSPIVTVNISINARPIATNVTVTTYERTPITFSLAANDPDNPLLTYTLLSHPGLGDMADPPGTPLGSAPTLTYTPTTINATGNNVYDTFTFKVNDGRIDSVIATVSITIKPVNDPPVAISEPYDVSRDGILTIPGPSGVLANDSDEETSHAGLRAVLDEPSMNLNTTGMLSLNQDGSFTYFTPPGISTENLPPINIHYQVCDDGSGDANSTAPKCVRTFVQFDITAPANPHLQVTWMSPTQNELIYRVGKETIQLRAAISGTCTNSCGVRYMRWDTNLVWTDSNNQVHIGGYRDLGVISSPPYQFNLDTASLNLDYNEILAVATDNGVDASPRRYIWIKRFNWEVPALRLYLPFINN